MDVSIVRDATVEFERRLAAVNEEQWTSPTPCSEWDVRTLVNHVTGELLWIPPLIEGKTIAEVGDRFDGDVLGDDPLAVFRSAAVGAIGAVSDPAAQERIVHLSYGDFTGGEYLGQVTSDIIIHTWDLARAIGADDRLEPALVRFADEFLAPQIEMWRQPGVFDARVETAPDADAQDRFLAETGRSAAWPD